MGSKVGKTHLKPRGKIDTGEEDNKEDTTVKERNIILIVEKEKVIKEYMLGGYFTEKYHCSGGENEKDEKL